MRIRDAMELARPFTLLAPALGVTLGAVAPCRVLGVAYEPGRVALAVLAAACATGASNAWNQAFDADIDRRNKPDRPVPSGRVTVDGARRMGHALAVLALAFAAAVGLGRGVERFAFAACVAVGLLGTWIYSAPPLRTKRRTLGANVTIAIPRGFLVPVAGWAVLAAPLAFEPWALGWVPGLFVLGAASTKDFADIVGDREHGCRTLPVLLGPRRAARTVAPFLVLPFLLYPLLSLFHALSRPLVAWCVLAAVLCGLGAFAARSLLADPESLATERNHPAWRAMYLLLLTNQAGVAAVYLFT